jgi:hypothetical protein
MDGLERSRTGFCLVDNCFVIVYGKKSLRTIQLGKIDFDKAFLTYHFFNFQSYS